MTTILTSKFVIHLLKKKLCPKCLKEVKGTNPLGGWLLPQEYHCDACGYHGIVAVEYDENKKTGS